MRQFGYIGLFLCLLLSFPAIRASAQPMGTPYASVKSAVVEPAKAGGGQKAALVVTIDISSGFHINANKPDDANSVPTILSISAPKTSGVVVGKPVFPATKTITVGYSPKPIHGYEETVVIRVPLTIPSSAKAGTVKLSGMLHAQGCNATTCFPPQSFPVNATLTVTGAKK